MKIISFPKTDHVIVFRQSLVAVCADAPDPQCAAACLSQMIYWTEVRLRHQPQAARMNEIAASGGEAAQQDDGLWVYRTIDEMITETMGLFGRNKMQAAVQWLVQTGLLMRRLNPKYQWDRSYQYLLQTDVLQQLIDTGSAACLHGLELNDASFKTKLSTVGEAETDLLSLKLNSREFKIGPAIQRLNTETKSICSADESAAAGSTCESRNEPQQEGMADTADTPPSPPAPAQKQQKEPPAPAQRVTYDHAALLTAISDVLAVRGELLNTYASFLRGTAKRGDWKLYSLPAANPVDADELRAFATDWRRQHPGLDVPTKPSTLSSELLKWREKAVRGSVSAPAGVVAARAQNSLLAYLEGV